MAKPVTKEDSSHWHHPGRGGHHQEAREHKDIFGHNGPDGDKADFKDDGGFKMRHRSHDHKHPEPHRPMMKKGKDGYEGHVDYSHGDSGGLEKPRSGKA
jgi:hypothetical protein